MINERVKDKSEQTLQIEISRDIFSFLLDVILLKNVKNRIINTCNNKWLVSNQLIILIKNLNNKGIKYNARQSVCCKIGGFI